MEHDVKSPYMNSFTIRYGVTINPPVEEEDHRDPGGPVAFALEESKKVTIAALNVCSFAPTSRTGICVK